MCTGMCLSFCETNEIQANLLLCSTVLNGLPDNLIKIRCLNRSHIRYIENMRADLTSNFN